MSNKKTRQEFFKALFGDADGLFEIRTFGNGEKSKAPLFLDSLEKLCGYDFPQDINIYYGCAPRATRGGKKENVGTVTALWADVDYGADGHKQKPVYMTADEARAAIRERIPDHMQPGIIVDSGGGFHCYWILKEPEPVDTLERRERVENIMRGLSAILGGDSTHDVSRVFRVPETNNLKIPGQPRLCRVIHFAPDQRFNLSDFDFALEAAPQAAQTPHSGQQAAQGLFKFEALPGWCKTIIMSGNDDGYKSKSERDYAVIKPLVRGGATDADIKDIFAKYAVGDKVRRESGGWAYLRRSVSKARSELEPMPQQQDGKGKGINPGAEAARILADYKFKYVCEDYFYIYGAGYWRRVNETYLLAIIDGYLGEKAKRAHRSEVLEKLRLHADVQLPPDGEMNPHREFINLNSGMLDISTGKVLPHSPDYLSTLRIATPHVTGAACPAWLKFLSEVLPDETQRGALQEFFGYSLTTDCKFEKSAILYGESGCNGKSVTLHILETLLGEENCTHEPWALLTEPFHIIRLRGRLLNVSAETPPNEATDTSLFKQLVSGDPVSDSHKHRDRVDFRPFAKLAFACNTLPRIFDSSEAFFRRVLLFNFPISFQGREDRTLTSRLTQELPGILNWAIEGLQRLRANNQFTQSEKSAEMLEQFRRQNNPVRTFVMEKCIIGGALEVSKATLFKAYKDFCDESEFKATSNPRFFRELYRCADVEQFKNVIDGKGVPSIIGLTLSGGGDYESE